jgi:hypothetical protein
VKTIIKPDNDWWGEIDQTIRCQCGAEFRGRAQIKNMGGGNLVEVVDRECPGCGPEIQITRVSSDPEIWTI